MKEKLKTQERPRPSRARRKIGKAPGTITYLGRREKAESSVHVFDYSLEEVREDYPNTLDKVLSYKNTESTSWIDVVGLNDEAFIENLGTKFGLKSFSCLKMLLIPSNDQKSTKYDSYIFGVFKMLYLNETNELVSEHVAIVLFEKCVLVFQEVREDVFEGVRNRLTSGLGRMRTRGSDYLFFALLDAIIDNYFVVLENINNRMEILEEEVYDNPTPDVAQKIQRLKKEVLKIRRYIYPVKELVSRLIDSESPLISADTKLFLRDGARS